MANFKGSDLTGADLRGACLRGAVLTDAILENTDTRAEHRLRCARLGAPPWAFSDHELVATSVLPASLL